MDIIFPDKVNWIPSKPMDEVVTGNQPAHVMSRLVWKPPETCQPCAGNPLDDADHGGKNSENANRFAEIAPERPSENKEPVEPLASPYSVRFLRRNATVDKGIHSIGGQRYPDNVRVLFSRITLATDRPSTSIPFHFP